MRKMILTLMLATASGVWMTSEGVCVARAPQHMTQQAEIFQGILGFAGAPCEDPMDEEYPCPECITLILRANNIQYYLTSDDNDMMARLNALESQLPLGRADISGFSYQSSGYHYINVQSIDTDPSPMRLRSLCDEWNIAQISNAMGPQEVIHTVKAVLGTDTTVWERYVKLTEAGVYKGAMREGNNGDVYYIPAGSTHEYLLYDFHANAGDRLSNLWYGGRQEWCPNGYNATVLSISEGTSRVFTVEVEYVYSDSDGDHTEPWLVYWTEGVGLSDGPAGQPCPGPHCACSCGQVVLCAYKNGEHIYTSDLGEQYGCVYNYDPYSNTIPVYSYTGDAAAPAAQKILRDGELLIVKGEKVYTVQGTEVRE